MNSLFIVSVLLFAAIHVHSRDQRSIFSWGDDQPKEEEQSPVVVPGYKPALQVRKYNTVQVNSISGAAPTYYESNAPISVDQFSGSTGSQLSNDELRYFDFLNKYAVPAFSEDGLRDFDVTSILPLVNLIPEDSIDRLSYAVELAPATQVKEKSKFLALLAYLKELKLKPFKYVANVGSELIHKKKSALGYLVPSLTTTPQTPTHYESIETTPASYVYNYGPEAAAYTSLSLSPPSRQVNYFSHQPNYQHLESVLYYSTTPAPVALPQQSVRRESMPSPKQFHSQAGFSEYPSNLAHLNGDDENLNTLYHQRYNPIGPAVPPPSQSIVLDGQTLSQFLASPSSPGASWSRFNQPTIRESGAPLYRNPSTNRPQYSPSQLPSYMMRVGNPTLHAHTHPDSTSFLSGGDMEISASETVQKGASAQQQQHKLSDGTSVVRVEGNEVNRMVDIPTGPVAKEVHPENRTTSRPTQKSLLVSSKSTVKSTPHGTKQPQFSSSQTNPTATSSPVA